ncbi:pyridoxal phosphate-dependent aminotransferase [Algihabitans albus]|uniref:pyridoxal phosphate-dependent aminotransferase n=1 Tax=Algihabitans albus TaxID=2164067 RepID=UPI0035D12A6D
MQNVAPSATKAMVARTRALEVEGHDIVALTQGEPDFDTPVAICEAGVAAIRGGRTRYTPVTGILDLREAIVGNLQTDHSLVYSPDEIIVGCGAKQVITNALLATLDPGDEVIVPAPCWVTYPEVVKLAGGIPVIVDCLSSPTFKFTPEQFARAVTPRTRWLVLNSPCNPTGAVYNQRDLVALAEILRMHPHVAVLCDEIYEKLVYQPARFASLAAIAPDLRDRILIVNGVSKAHAMTGWRVGYGAGPVSLVKAMATIQGQTTSHTSSIAQYAALEALAGNQSHLDVFRDTFRKRRDFICDRLNQTEGLTCRVPDGTFYVLASCSALLGRRTSDGMAIDSDIDFATWLLESFGVAVVPGASFLAPGHIRLSYAASKDEITRACDRLQAACETLAVEAA